MAAITLGPFLAQRMTMPFKSKAQRRKFAQLLVEGKITDAQYEEWNRSTGRKVLPERVHPKKDQRKTKVRRRSAVGAKKRAARRNSKRR